MAVGLLWLHPLAAHELLTLHGLFGLRERRVGHDGKDALAHLHLVHGCSAEALSARDRSNGVVPRDKGRVA